MCTESPTPTASRNDGRIVVGNFNAVPLALISPIVETSDRTTTTRGRSTAETRRNSQPDEAQHVGTHGVLDHVHHHRRTRHGDGEVGRVEVGGDGPHRGDDFAELLVGEEREFRGSIPGRELLVEGRLEAVGRLDAAVGVGAGSDRDGGEAAVLGDQQIAIGRVAHDPGFESRQRLGARRPFFEQVFDQQLVLGAACGTGVDEARHLVEMRHLGLEPFVEIAQGLEKGQVEDPRRLQRQHDQIVATELIAKAVVGDERRVVFVQKSFGGGIEADVRKLGGQQDDRHQARRDDPPRAADDEARDPGDPQVGLQTPSGHQDPSGRAEASGGDTNEDAGATASRGGYRAAERCWPAANQSCISGEIRRIESGSR
jgi:hypothetical protein